MRFNVTQINWYLNLKSYLSSTFISQLYNKQKALGSRLPPTVV